MAPALTAAYDELIGPGRWEPGRSDIGEAVVVRFPSGDERANAGYHIEGSYARPGGRHWLGERPLPGARAAGAVPVHRRRAR